MFSSAHPHAELQSIQAIQPSDALPIDEPPLTPQQNPDPHVAKSRPRMRQIPNAEPESRLILCATVTIPGSSTKLRQAAGPRTAHLKRPVKPLGQFPAAGGP